MRIVLYTTIETLRIAAILLQPVMPAAMSKLLDLLAVCRAANVRRHRSGRTYGDFNSPKRLQPAVCRRRRHFPRYVEPEAAAK